MDINQGMLDDYNASMVGDKLWTPNGIYVDICWLKDIYLGGLIASVKTEAQYRSLYQGVERYQKRVIDDPSTTHPELGITLKQLEEVLLKEGEKVYRLSPVNTFMVMFHNLLISINNKDAVTKKKRVPKLIINLYPIELSDDKKVAIGLYYNELFGFDTRVISKPIETIDVSVIKALDLMYIYDFHRFIESERYSKEFSELHFEHLRIYTLKRIKDVEILDKCKTKEQLDKEFNSIEIYMNFMCHFDYLPNLTVCKTE